MKQWDDLIDLFKDEFCKLYGMTTDSLLNIHLQAGLSALKTPYPLLHSFVLDVWEYYVNGNFSPLLKVWPKDFVMRKTAQKKTHYLKKCSGNWQPLYHFQSTSIQNWYAT